MSEPSQYRLAHIEKDIASIEQDVANLKHKLNNMALEVQAMSSRSEVAELTIRIERLITTGKTLTWVFGFVMTMLSIIITIRELAGSQ